MSFENFNQVEHTIAQLNAKIAEFEKAIASTQTAFPVRENLAGEVVNVIESSTPLLNRFPTKPGSGKAAAWKELTSYGSAPSSVFYTEGGTPVETTSVYADRSENYKLLAVDGSVTAFAVDSGANFQDQLATEKRNKLIHLRQLEEDALINADGTGLQFSGLLTQIASGNGSYQDTTDGTPASAVRGDLDDLLKATFDKGASISAFVVRSTEARIISDAITGDTASPIRVPFPGPDGKIIGGFFVNGYRDPFTGQVVELLPDIKHTEGTIIALAEKLPVPISGQGGMAMFLDVLLDYAMSDVPSTADAFKFRVKRYYTFAMPGRKFCGKITDFS